MQKLNFGRNISYECLLDEVYFESESIFFLQLFLLMHPLYRWLLSTLSFHSLQNVGREVLVVTLIATFVMLWNMLTGEYTDLVGGVHPGILRGQYTPVLALPMNPFTLSSSFLGLLLVFRTNKAYQRWDEARKNWGMNM